MTGKTLQRLLAACGLSVALWNVPAHAAGDATAGQTFFKRVCAMCHSTVAGRNMIGPSLAGVVGRTSGTAANYTYSHAMADAHLVWTPENLDKYLTSPQAAVPGNKMPYPGIKDATDRANVVAYLATLK
ncbi:MAG TPA: cytochrome c family protein [Acetobacteraceae bacterium]|nr:cytochrome c family protein [Acetobacteraceae bacterium]